MSMIGVGTFTIREATATDGNRDTACGHTAHPQAIHGEPRPRVAGLAQHSVSNSYQGCALTGLSDGPRLHQNASGVFGNNSLEDLAEGDALFVTDSTDEVVTDAGQVHIRCLAKLLHTGFGESYARGRRSSGSLTPGRGRAPAAPHLHLPDIHCILPIVNLGIIQ